ncbi:MAG: hypothetical protein ACFFBU_04000 [Promethearchaeota archaeon]
MCEWLAIKGALEKVFVHYDQLHKEVQQLEIPTWEDEVEHLEKVYNRLLRE